MYFQCLLTFCLFNINYGHLMDTEIEVCLKEALERVKNELNGPLIPNEVLDVNNGYVNAWDEATDDFYYPNTFNEYDGHKTELFLSTLYEDVNSRFKHGPITDMVLINTEIGKILVTSTEKFIFVKGITSRPFFQVFDFANVVNIVYVKYFNKGQDEVYLIALQNLMNFQKILIIKFNIVDMKMDEISSLNIQPHIVKIYLIPIQNARKNLLFAIRHKDVRRQSKCSSDLFELIFDEKKLVLTTFQSIRTSGAVDVESFSINRVTYIAIANSYCNYSDIFVFDVNGFYLYQRFPIRNATDFQYFKLGFRHFIAAISPFDIVIFEWQIDGLVPIQSFQTSGSQIKHWKNLNVNLKNEAILLLVSSNEIQIMKWSKLEGKFVFETKPICTNFLQVPNLRRNDQIKGKVYADLAIAKLNCILDRELCVGVSQFDDNGVIKYIPESNHHNLIPYSHDRNSFWFKIYGLGFSCLIDNIQIITPKIQSYSNEDSIYILVPFTTEIKTFILTVNPMQILESTNSVVLGHLTEIEKTLTNYENILENKIKETIQLNYVTETTEQTILEPIIFNTTVKVFEEINTDLFDFKFLSGEPTLYLFDERFKILQQKITEFLIFLNNAVDITKPIIELPRNIHFTDLDVKETFVSKKRVEVTRINSVPIINLMDTAATWDQIEPIHGKKTFIRPIIHTGNIRVINLIGGHHFPRDILTTQNEQIFNGEWHFDHNIEVENVQIEVLNGINMTQSVNIIHTEHTVIHHAPKYFMNRLEIQGDLIVNTINGIDLEHLVQNAVTKSGENVITGKKYFTKNVIVTDDLNVAETINEFDIVRLDDEIVKNDKPAHIIGPKLFIHSVFATKDVNVNGLINDQYQFPNDFVTQKSTVLLLAPKHFSAPIIINGDLSVTDSINGVPTESAVTLYTQQDIIGEKIFTGGIDVKNLKVDGTIDGMTIQELIDIVNNGRFLPFKPIHFQKFDVRGDLEGVNYINGFLVTDLISDAVFKDEKKVILNEEKIFLKATRVIGNVQNLNIINKMNLQTDFVSRSSHQRIFGKKTFIKQTTFKDMQIDGLINHELNLTQYLNSVVNLDSLQEINSKIHFMDGFTIEGNLKVDGQIDSIRIPKNVLLKNETKVIHAPKFFLRGLNTNVVTTNSMEFNGLINSVEWRKFKHERVTLSTAQNIYSKITFIDDVKITEDLRVIGRINNIELPKLTQDAMWKSRPQIVTGIKTITGEVTAENIITDSSRGLSAINFTQLDTTIVRIHDNKLNDKIYFDEVIVKENTIIKGKINNWDFNDVISDSVKKTSNEIQHINGLKIFSETIKIKGDLNVITINGLNPLTDILLKSQPQLIPGFFKLQQVEVNDITVNGKINGINLIEFEKQALKTNENVNLKILTLENDIIIEKDLNIVETINKIDLQQLMNNSVPKNDIIRIKGFKEFTGIIHVFGNVTVKNTVNDIKLSNFVKDVILLTGTENVEITGIKTFTSEIETSKSILITGNVTITGNVNEINLNHLLTSTFYPNRSNVITGKKIFKKLVTIEKNVKFTKSINEINIPIDIVLKSGNQPIFGTKKFEHVIIRGDLKGQQINGYVLQDLYDDTVFITNHRPITGIKILKKKTIFKSHVNVDGKLCGLNFDTDVMTKNGHQSITGIKKFKQMTVKGNMNIVNLNGYELNLNAELLRNLEPSIDSHYRFLGKTIFTSVEHQTELIELPNVKAIEELFKKSIDLKLTLNEAVEKCEIFDELTKPLIEAPEKLINFQLEFTIDLRGDFRIIRAEKHVYLFLRVKNEICGPNHIFIWNREKFVSLKPDFVKGNSVEFELFKYKNKEFLITTQPNRKCVTSSRVYILNKFTLQFELFCSFNISFTQATILRYENLIFVAVLPQLKIFTIELNKPKLYCEIHSQFNYNKVGNFVMALKQSKLFVVADSIGIEFFNPNSAFSSKRISMPGIQRMISTTINNKEFIIIERNLHFANLNIIQVYEFTNFNLNLIKQTKPMDKPILDLKLFEFGAKREIYLAILYRKIGIFIMKLEGYETSDLIDLPIASAKQFDVFTLDNRPYLLISPVGRRYEVHVYSGIVKGFNAQLNITCSP